MAVKLSAEQERNAQIIHQVLDEHNASPRVRLSAFEGAWVESGLKNLHYGDADSEGVYQQRPSQGWGSVAEVTNVRHAAEEYVKRAIAANAQGGSAGEVAQRVQRSGFPGRYDASRSIARQIMLQTAGSSASPRGSRSGGTGLAADLARPDSVLAQDSSPGSPLALTIPSAPPVTAPTPANAPAPIFPQSYPGAPMAGSPGALAPQQVQQPAVADNSTDFGTPSSPAASGGSSSVSGGSQGHGHVIISSGANKPGQPLQKGILGVLGTLAGALPGGKVTVGTGTNHSRFVAGTTRVSDHAAGNASDIPATGGRLTGDATTALVTFAEGKTVQWLRNDGTVKNIRVTASNARTLAESGGIWNVEYQGGRLQLIANTHQGGDHTNHLHVGYVPGR